jgi:hypothetical protein
MLMLISRGRFYPPPGASTKTNLLMQNGFDAYYVCNGVAGG